MQKIRMQQSWAAQNGKHTQFELRHGASKCFHVLIHAKRQYDSDLSDPSDGMLQSLFCHAPAKASGRLLDRGFAAPTAACAVHNP